MFNVHRVFVLTLIACVLTFGLHSPAQAGLKLVEQGRRPLPIVVYEDAPQLTELAAQELATYIEKITGSKPQVIKGWPEPTPEKAIWVGYQKGLEKLLPGVDMTFDHPEEILIATNDNHLLIAGRDRWHPDHLDQLSGMIEHGYSREMIITGVQQEYGTANAVYEFLHRNLGVRWLWPGEIEIPTTDTLTIEPGTYRYHPQMRSRMQMFWHLSRGRQRVPGHEENDWYRFNHVLLDSMQTHAGEHAFGDWWERFSKTHPEYFALQPDGTRSGFPGGKRAKICEANPAVWEQWLKDVDETLKKNPTQIAFSAAANDSWTSGHCICELCRAWDDLSAPRRMFVWQGLAQEYVALSDRQVHFANTLGRLLKERYPGRELYVSILAYGLSRPAPTSVVPDDNVIIGSVAAFFANPDGLDRAGDNEKHVDQFKAWGKVAKHLYWRPNNSSVVQKGQPLSTRLTADHFKVLAESNAIGIYIDTIYRYWGLNGHIYYLMARLTWDPHQNAQAVIDDYCDKAFGPAAKTVGQYFKLIDDAVDRHQALDNGLDGESWSKSYTPEFFKQAHALMDEARQAAAGQDKYIKRLAYLASGLEFLELQTQSLQLIPQVGKKSKTREAALAQMTANWQRVLAIDEAFPYAIPNHFVTQIRKRPVEINPKAYE